MTDIESRANTSLQVVAWTTLALLAFAGNSLLCRAALLPVGGRPAIDPLTFTAVRLVSGALVLLPFLLRREGPASSARPLPRRTGAAAVALFGYAVAFSFAYVSLPTGVGALLLFGSVQLCMLGVSRLREGPLGARRACGALLAFTGLCVLVVPDILDGRGGVPASPGGESVGEPGIESAGEPGLEWGGVVAMVLAGVAWGAYTLLGRGSSSPTRQTARNFLLAAPCGMLVLGVAWATGRHAAFGLPDAARWLQDLRGDDAGGAGRGLLLALASGALCSGLGYAIWYRALRHHTAVSAALCQLTVPLLAALLAALLLAEPLTPRWAVASVVVLGGVVLGSRPAGST